MVELVVIVTKEDVVHVSILMPKSMSDRIHVLKKELRTFVKYWLPEL